MRNEAWLESVVGVENAGFGQARQPILDGASALIAYTLHRFKLSFRRAHHDIERTELGHDATNK